MIVYIDRTIFLYKRVITEHVGNTAICPAKAIKHFGCNIHLRNNCTDPLNKAMINRACALTVW